MSMIDRAMRRDRRRTSQSAMGLGAASMELPRIETPIVPRSTIAARALVAVVAIMTFLASLTAGAVILVHAAARDWQADVAREITIQVRPTSGRDLEADVQQAATIARALPGIAAVRPFSKEESGRLLEPWLGAGLALDELPVPRIIVVRVVSGAAPDLAELRSALRERLPAASLDDHRDFLDRMRTMSGAAVLAGICLLGLVIVATILSVTFATRAAMATNRPVIEVLHFIGARNSFITQHFQRHFLQLGLIGGAIGGGGAVALFALAHLASHWSSGGIGNEQVAALFGTMSLGPFGYLGVLAPVALIAGVTAATSRHTVNRTIELIR